MLVDRMLAGSTAECPCPPIAPFPFCLFSVVAVSVSAAVVADFLFDDAKLTVSAVDDFSKEPLAVYD